MSLMVPQGNAEDARILGFLKDSLAVWGVEGTIEEGRKPVIATIRAGADTVVQIERSNNVSFRWLVRSHHGASSHVHRSRPCASVVGLLNATRNALGVDRGDSVRIVPAPIEE